MKQLRMSAIPGLPKARSFIFKATGSKIFHICKGGKISTPVLQNTVAGDVLTSSDNSFETYTKRSNIPFFKEMSFKFWSSSAKDPKCSPDTGYNRWHILSLMPPGNWINTLVFDNLRSSWEEHIICHKLRDVMALSVLSHSCSKGFN